MMKIEEEKIEQKLKNDVFGFWSHLHIGKPDFPSLSAHSHISKTASGGKQ